MIHSIAYRARIASTGRVLEATLDLSDGTTVVTGPNESGKSFFVEMIRFALFGTAALRDKVSDFAELKVSAVVRIRDRVYGVSRDLRNATLILDGAPLATGTKPVNAKLLEILGFGLDVFDIACISNQGDMERIGAMRPTERRQMVDQVIGINRIDALQKWCGDEALILTREIDALSRHLVKPIEPIMPEGYAGATGLGTEITEARQLVARHDRLETLLSTTRPSPVRPEPPCAETAEDLDGAVAYLRAQQLEHQRISRLPVLDYDPAAVAAKWEAFDGWEAHERFVRAHPLSPLARAVVEGGLASWQKHQARTDLLNRLEKLKASPTATCPECAHEFHLAHDHISDLEEKIAAIGDYVLPRDKPDVLMTYSRRLDDWDMPATKKEAESLAQWNEVLKPTHPRHPPAGAIGAAEKATMLAALGEVHDPQPIAALAAQRRAYEAHVAVYDKAVLDHEAHLRDRAHAEAALSELGPLPDVEAMERRYRDAVIYESQLADFTRAEQTYAAVAAEVTEKSAEAEGWRAARAAFGELRLRVKAHIVPSLNRVASHLLALMTGGQRQSIVVDEAFEVLVDGQSLQSLSGSGKVCANLALRLGLGQVLTHGVMSLFVGDEIDASMDAERANKTHKMLMLIADTLAQVIVITHKDISADHRISFG